MNERRDFLRAAGVAAPAAAALLLTRGVSQAQDGDVREFLGAWTTVHSLPFPPGAFQEFLAFSSGGVLMETNSFLNNRSRLDFSAFGLPASLSASDGFGNWERTGPGRVSVAFRKMLFDGDSNYIGELRATGTLRSDGKKLTGEWTVEVRDLNDNLMVPLGPATSEGTRIA